MNSLASTMPSRRAFLGGSAALALAACSSVRPISFTEAVRRLLMLASDNAFAQLTAPGGFWDREVVRLDLPSVFDKRGVVLQAILTSAPVKQRLQREFNHVAERASYRAAPVVAETVRTIGIENAVALLRGGPTAATGFLRGNMAGSLIDVMAPELGDGLRVAKDPIVGQAIAALSGIDLNGVARSFSVDVDNAIWGEIGRQEAEIRAHPEKTNDPLLIAALKAL